MKRIAIVLLSILLALSVFTGCQKSQKQVLTERTSTLTNKIDGAKDIAPGTAKEERLGELREELSEASSKLDVTEISDDELKVISEEIDKIEKNIEAIVSGEKSESDVLLDKYARVANLYTDIATELAGTPTVTQGSFSSIGFKVTDIATNLAKNGENLSQDELNKLSAELDELEEKLLEIKNSK